MDCTIYLTNMRGVSTFSSNSRQDALYFHKMSNYSYKAFAGEEAEQRCDLRSRGNIDSTLDY